MIVQFTAAGLRQFFQALAFIAEQNPAAATRLRVRAETRLRRLERFPHSGRRLPEFPNLPQREVVVRPYRFIYRVDDRKVWIVAVWHSAQDLKRFVRPLKRR